MVVNSSNLIDISSSDVNPISRTSYPASSLQPYQRINLALQALTEKSSISELSRQAQVSRKFIYQQADRAILALDQAFSQKQSKDDQEVLFYLPVTKAWLRQLILALLLICHASYRGVIDLLRDLFDTELSIGSVHNIAYAAVEKARIINDSYDLSPVRVSNHDEIFQGRNPVLAGIDAHSTYCYLLALEEHRDAVTWAVHLLDLEKQGLHPDYTVADAGKGLRAGQQLAWDTIPCFSDHFHAIAEVTKLVTYLENRAFTAMNDLFKLQCKMQKAKRKNQGHTLSKKLAFARQNESVSTSLAEDVRILANWLRQDVLAKDGPAYSVRSEMFDFIVEQLKQLEPLCPHRIRPVRCFLQNQRDDLLAFADLLDQAIHELSIRFQVAPQIVRQMLTLQEMEISSYTYWQTQGKLRGLLKDRFYPLHQEVCELRHRTVRASSLVENLNSRLRNYFFLRRNLGSSYLDLLRFFLNHRTFDRSNKPQRVGKSPAQLLTGQPHPHWLELLGFKLFRRSN